MIINISIYPNLDRQSIDYYFYQAIRLVHQEDFQHAQSHINKAFKVLATKLTSLLAESYNKSYHSIVIAQQLTELQEVMQYKILTRQAGSSAVDDGQNQFEKRGDQKT